MLLRAGRLTPTAPLHCQLERVVRTPRAFSLIELLVVISIIALLIGILLPVLGSARASARASVCQSNIRQLVIANTAYSVDHADRYVPGAANFLANLDRWHGARDNMSDAFDPARGPMWEYLRPQEIKACPEFVEDDDYTPGFEAGNGGYGYNNEYVGRDERGSLSTRLGALAHWFSRPSATVVFTDAAFVLFGPRVIEYSFSEPPFQPGGSPYDPSIHFRHGGATNIAWLDGHVDADRLAFSRPNIYGISEAENLAEDIGWFGPADNTLFDRD